MPLFGTKPTTSPTTPFLEPTRRRRGGEKKARPISILVTPPRVSERDSSLYKYAQPANHLTNNYEQNAPYETTHQQRFQSITSTPQLLTPRPSPSPSSTSRSSSYQTTRPSTYCESTSSTYSLETPLSEEGYGNQQLQQQPFTVKRKSKFIEEDIEGVYESDKRWKKSNLSLGSLALASFSQLNLGLGSKSKEKKVGFRAFGMKSEVGLNSFPVTDPAMTSVAPAPVVPPRSRLRSMPAPQLSERRSSLYLLPVDPPLEATPSLSSGSSSDQEMDEQALETSLSKKRGSGRGSGSGDPMRIRDGAMVRKASSGLYTPPTFPGAQGPRPSHFPSHVYTPPAFTLNPTSPKPTPNNYSTPSLPSRSVSASSATSATSTSNDLLTPSTPSSSRFGKTLTSLRRISNQIIQTPSPTTTPTISSPSPTTSYFSNSKSGHTSWSSSNYNFPLTPVNRSFGYQAPTTPGGLGVGPLGEVDIEGAITSLSFDEDGEIKSMAVKPPVKGWRKPVPKILDVEIESDEGMEREVVHAL